MEILLWLAPPVVVTGIAMVWVAWLGREGRGQIDREEAARRIGAVLEREPRAPGRPAGARARVDGERSTGVAVRRPADVPAVPAPDQLDQTTQPAPVPRRLAS